MAESRLGRGLAALIGDVGEETRADRARRASRAACRSNTCGPIRAIRARLSPTPSSTSSPPRSASAASSSRSWCARCGAERRFRDHRRRAALARGAARRPARRADRVRRGDRRAGARARDHRERAARRPQSARGGERLSVALIDEFNYTQDEMAQIVGKSRPHVANTLRLLKLSEPVKALVRAGKLSAGHARLLVGQPNARGDRATTIVDAGPERAPGRGRDARGRHAAGARHQARVDQIRSANCRPRTPTRARWSGGCPTCSGLTWPSITRRPAAARCISSTRIWISSTRC